MKLRAQHQAQLRALRRLCARAADAIHHLTLTDAMACRTCNAGPHQAHDAACRHGALILELMLHAQEDA